MRFEQRLSGRPWRLWLDRDAEWQDDALYPPSRTVLSELPSNPPTIGWDGLDDVEGPVASLPACVEEFFSGGVNDWTYHGVSWFTTDFVVPEEAEGRRIVLCFERTRLRAEIYVNRELVGYDLVSETPYTVDVGRSVRCGQTNTVAIRITNPGGTRGWHDIVSYNWGTHEMLPAHDFGFVGHVDLLVTDPTYIGDLFVKNELPAGENRITVIAEIEANEAGPVDLSFTVRTSDHVELVHTDHFSAHLQAGTNALSRSMVVPSAARWELEEPRLHQGELRLSASTDDAVRVRFGFRVFEVRRDADGLHRFFLNGRRFRHKSAIDWGYYAHTGAYATEEMAERSVRAAKAIGHNGINFHRQIGEPLVLEKADEHGVVLYEEPGGLKSGDLSPILRLIGMIKAKPFVIERNSLAQELLTEKLRRMVRRDRNHPSLFFYGLANEDNKLTPYRRDLLDLVQELDGSRMVCNSSGSNGTPSVLTQGVSRILRSSILRVADRQVVRIGRTHVYQPYATELSTDHVDCHTVDARSRFVEEIFESHKVRDGEPTRYWGEVGCYCGPANWSATSAMQKSLPDGRSGYDDSIYRDMHHKLSSHFEEWGLAGGCSGAITSVFDVSRQAGRGLMYIDGRFSQTICSYDGADGYAINGWSSGPQVGRGLPKGERILMDWDSAILDEARNVKGPPEDYRYWTRPVQIAIFRRNGKYFTPGKVARFRVTLINEGMLEPGTYSVKFRVVDETGSVHAIEPRSDVEVEVDGGTVFSQELDELAVTMGAAWSNGHITVEADLLDADGVRVAGGSEQVLLDNPPSLRRLLGAESIAVCDWSQASDALGEVGADAQPFDREVRRSRIVASGVPDRETVEAMLAHVEHGSLLVVDFDQAWASALLDVGVLSSPVTEWGCRQTGYWYGNGWGYIEEYVGSAVPSGEVIGTNGWQPTRDPNGFYPLKSDFPIEVKGLWLARPDVVRVLVARIDYGDGAILLDPSYRLDPKDVLSKMIFCNMLVLGLGATECRRRNGS